MSKDGEEIGALYAFHDRPVFAATITKCGCTFVKNLFYLLNYGEVHPLGDGIHKDESALPRALPEELETVKNSPYTFITFRHPRDRFLSLYFEKIYGRGPQSFPALGEKLERNIGLNRDENISEDAHIKNTLRLADWIALNFADKTDEPIDFHWRRQANKFRRVRNLNLTPTTLDGLTGQLDALLSPGIPDIAEKMALITSRNRSVKPIDPIVLNTPQLNQKLEALYPRDYQLYQRAKTYWQERGL